MPAPPADLAIARLALITFSRILDARWQEWVVEIAGFQIQVVSAYEDAGRTRLLLGATKPLEFRPKVTAQRELVISAAPRAAAERAIELAVNLITVGQGCRRWIASPWPPVVLIALGDDGREWLHERADTLQHGSLKSEMQTIEPIALDESVLSQLGDRDDGVALLVEALAQDHAMGRFRELIRFFECAFASPPKTLTAPAAAFLDTRFGYTETELRKWFRVLRDSAPHADQRRTVVLEADARPVIDRMLQATYDVLLNKAVWHDPSSTRRAL